MKASSSTPYKNGLSVIIERKFVPFEHSVTRQLSMNSCIFTTCMQESLGSKEAVVDNELKLQQVEEIVQEALI